MKRSANFLAISGAIFLGIMLLSPQGHAVEPVAKIARYSGAVYFQSGAKIQRVTQTGQNLYNGDLVQTKKGTVQITFNDGAIIKISAFTSTKIQEREERRGFIFKTRQAVRRLTCFAGKFWFKSGASKRKNYLQTPTAVMGVRGSDDDVGFDPSTQQSYSYVYSGKLDVEGTVIKQQLFRTFGLQAARQSPVYSQMDNAQNAGLRALRTGRPLDAARARLAAFDVSRQAAEIFKTSPSKIVRLLDGLLNGASVDASYAAANTEVVLEELKDNLEKAERTAQAAEASGDQATFQAARRAVDELLTSIDEVERLQERAEEAARNANAAAETGDLDGARRSAQQAQQYADEAVNIRNQTIEVIQFVVPTATLPEPEPEPQPEPELEAEPEDITPEIEITTTTTTTTTSTTIEVSPTF
jgi:flagellar hook-basal body complex protein FliE